MGGDRSAASLLDNSVPGRARPGFVIGSIIVITLSFVVLAASPYVRIWLSAEAKKDFTGFGFDNITALKDASSYLQSGVTVLILIGGAGWGLYTWFLQNESHRASLAPAIEVRIFAEQVTLQNQQEFLSEDKGLVDKGNTRLIKGFVTIKNVGTQKTGVQLCECVRPGAKGDPVVFVSKCVKPKNDQSVRLCEEDQHKDNGQAKEAKERIVAKGPIVVSRVYLKDEDKMHFVQTGRFWMTRFSVDNRPDVALTDKQQDLQRPDIVITDEMRPNAKDKLEFLVTAPGPGVYAIMFTSPLDEKESDRAFFRNFLR